MPRLRASAVTLDPMKWVRAPARAAGGPQTPHSGVMMETQRHPTPPTLPQHLTRSAVMLGSLPAIATSVSQGVTQQFYGGRMLPRRQLILPG